LETHKKLEPYLDYICYLNLTKTPAKSPLQQICTLKNEMQAFKERMQPVLAQVRNLSNQADNLAMPFFLNSPSKQYRQFLKPAQLHILSHGSVDDSESFQDEHQVTFPKLQALSKLATFSFGEILNQNSQHI